MSAHSVTPPLEWARGYHRRGWRPVPAPYRRKYPVLEGWPELLIAYDDLPRYFNANGSRQNICILLGKTSGAVVDVDLDAPEACRLGPLLLPPTAAVFGRQSKPRSHHLYVAKDPAIPETIQDLDWPGRVVNGKPVRILELRSTNLQTVFPGSAHDETGEEIRWDSEGEPGAVNADELTRLVRVIAAGCLLLPHWREGQRHKLQMALSGSLLRAGWAQDDAIRFVWAVAQAGGQDDPKVSTDIVRIVRDAGARLQAERSVYGLRTIADIVGDETTVNKFADWLGVGRADGHGAGTDGGARREGTRHQARQGRADEEGPWPARCDLPAGPQAPPLPVRELLPVGLRAYVLDAARLGSVPAVYVAVPLLVALAGVVGRAVGIRPEGYSDWLVVPNLWGAIVGPPGWLKSLALSEGMRPLERLAARARERAAEFRAQNEAREQRLEAALEGTKAAMRKAVEKDAAGKGTPGALDRLEGEWRAKKEELDELRAGARERRYVSHDPTVAKLGALLQENPRGLLVVRDELAGLLHSLEKAGSEGDRQFYLEAWNGTGGFTIDRIGRGTVHIPALTVSVLGGIQPGKLMPHVAGAEAGEELADGLLQRFQLLVWPDTLGVFHKPSRWPDRDARDAAATIFTRLDSLGDLLPADVERDGESKIPALRFDDAGQEVFDAWRAELEHRLRSGALRDAPAFEAHLSKYRSLMPSLALLFHLVEVAQGTRTDSAALVSAAAARLAAAWCAFLELHAAKVYDAELRPGVAAAQALAAKIEAGAIKDGEAARDIYRHHWSGLTTADQVAAGLAVLEPTHWVRVVAGGVSEQGGRFADRVRLHPDLRHKEKEGD